jgi:hypothetical protein
LSNRDCIELPPPRGRTREARIDVALVGRGGERLLGVGELGDLLAEPGLAAEAVDRLVARGAEDPGAWLVGQAALGPLQERGLEGVVEGLLGELEVAAEHADQPGEHPSRVLAVDRRDPLGHVHRRGILLFLTRS